MHSLHFMYKKCAPKIYSLVHSEHMLYFIILHFRSASSKDRNGDALARHEVFLAS